MRQISKLERQQKNISIIKTSLVVGSLMFIGFAYLMFNAMSL